jgi:p-hydroxybenzoate 3-monooxygenase
MTIEKELHTTVCIVGAGPAGIVLANILLQHHVDCIVIDAMSREEIFGRGRAGVIESTTVDCLKKHGLAEPILNNGRINDRCEFRSPAGSVTFEYGQLSGGETHSIYPQNNLVDDLTQIYLDGGGKIFFSRAGHKIYNEDDHIAVECYDKISQTIITMHANFVAGCDGRIGNTKPLFRPAAATARLHRRPLRARNAGGSPSTRRQHAAAARSKAERGTARSGQAVEDGLR